MPRIVLSWPIPHPAVAPLAFVIWLGLAAVPSYSLPAEVSGDLPGSTVAQAELTIQVKSRLGGPLEARVSVLDGAGNPVPPRDPSIPFYTAYTGHSYFYTDGTAVLDVPAGPVRVLVSRGPEYEAVDQTLDVTTRTTLNYRLRSLFSMRRDGWYSGDTHVHEAHGGDGAVYTIGPADVARIAKAEDLGVTGVLSNGPYFTGGPDPAGSASHVVYFGMEYRSALFGHMGILGLDTLLPFGCCLPGDPPYPTNHEIISLAGEQGATVIAAHPVTMNPELYGVDALAWPYSGFARELPADLVLGGLHAIDVASYSNYSNAEARRVWFDLLNLGYRIAPSAGTDASMNRYFDPPVGGFRVYVRLPAGQAFTLDNWLAGLRQGRSFVTNGPLVHDAVLGGRQPGESVEVSATAPTSLTATLNILTREPVDYVEVIHNGTAINRINFPAHQQSVSATFPVTVPPGDGWVVFLVRGSRPHATTVGEAQEAVTGPIYLTADAPGGARAAAAQRFVEWIDELDLMVRERTDGGRPDLVTEVLDVLDRARRRIAGKPPDAVPELPDVYALAGDPLSLRVEESGSRFRLSGGGTGEARLEIFDVLGRLVHEGPDRALPAEFVWEGAGMRGRVPAGVYFARIRGEFAASRAHRLVLVR